MKNSLSVVIPTKDRAAVLVQTLATLEEQEPGDAGFEIIVVDNGSSDGTVEQVKAHAQNAAIPIQLLEHPDGGAAAARNAGVAVASGEVILFLGDDTAPQSVDLVRSHIDLHAAHRQESYAVLGRITWTPRKPVTPFMHWLENGGPQFNYWEISAGPVDASSYFYSSHASVKRSMIDRAGGFDVRFLGAAIEDTDLGVRLADCGVELVYHPELVVLHDHPTTPEQSLRRSIRVGRAAALYNRLRPDRPHPGVQPPSGIAWTAARVAEPLLRELVEAPLPRAIQTKVWLAATRAAYARGYRLGPVAAE